MNTNNEFTEEVVDRILFNKDVAKQFSEFMAAFTHLKIYGLTPEAVYVGIVNVILNKETISSEIAQSAEMLARITFENILNVKIDIKVCKAINTFILNNTEDMSSEILAQIFEKFKPKETK